jgi:4-hydroxyphenylpyruvate dioxygenase
MDILTQPAPAATMNGADTFPINGTDHLEFYVGNAKQSALYYQAAFGFEWVAYMGPETGVRDRVSYVLAAKQNPPGAHLRAVTPTMKLRAT